MGKRGRKSSGPRVYVAVNDYRRVFNGEPPMNPGSEALVLLLKENPKEFLRMMRWAENECNERNAKKLKTLAARGKTKPVGKNGANGKFVSPKAEEFQPVQPEQPPVETVITPPEKPKDYINLVLDDLLAKRKNRVSP